MACKFEKEMVKSLQDKGILGENMMIQDIVRFKRINDDYTRFAKNKYHVESQGSLFFIKNTKSGIKAVPNKNMFDEISEKTDQVEVEFDMDFFENINVPEMKKPPSFENYLVYKKDLLSRARRRLREIRIEEKKLLKGENTSENVERLKELARLRNVLEERVGERSSVGLVSEIAKLEDSTTLDKFKYYAQKDFERLNALMNNPTAENINEARLIIDFYKNMGVFSTEKDVNPLFSKEEIFDENNNLKLDEDIVKFFQLFASEAEKFSDKVYNFERDLILKVVNGNDKVQSTFEKEFSYDELFKTKTGLKDITWADMWIMDITNGIFSHNGLIPQSMYEILQNTMDIKLSYAADVESRLDKIQSKVEKILRDKGQGLSIKLAGMGISGVSYDMFRAKDENDNLLDSIIQRFSPKWTNTRNRIYSEFRRAIAEANKIENTKAREKAYNKADKNLKRQLRENAVLIDVRKIPEIINDPEFAEFSEFFDEKYAEVHKKRLIGILGEKGYAEIVKEQKHHLKSYQTMRQVTKDDAIVEEGVQSFDDISKKAQSKFDRWEKVNNPFLAAEAFYTERRMVHGGTEINTNMRFNMFVPRRMGAKKIEGQYISSNKETGFYDKRFEEIENNETLKEFYDLIVEVQERIYDLIPESRRRNFSPTSLPAMRKTLNEALLDKNTGILQRLSEAFRIIIQKLKELFGERIQDNFSYANVNTITGRPDYQVSSSFLKSNREYINDMFYIERQKMKIALNLPPTDPFRLGEMYDIRDNQKAIDILARVYNVEANLEALQNRLPMEDMKSLDVARLLRAGITHNRVSEMSFDLPKILKAYSYLTMQYAARREALPVLNIMKNHYDRIKDPDVTREGKPIVNARGEKVRFKGERERAKRQMESWFNRAVLGDYSSKNEFGDTTIKIPKKLGVIGNEKIDKAFERFQFLVTGNIVNAEDKEVKESLPELENELEIYESTLSTNNDLSEKEEVREREKIEFIRQKLQNLGQKRGIKFSLTSVLDGIFQMIRFLGLGWNVNSSITNFMEGQVANMTMAASGRYFTPENIYRANNIVQGSFVKNLTFGRVATKGSVKASILMQRYDVLQDASNELQKASTKSAFSNLQAYSPYELIRRTEYLNQTPLMISILMDQEITDKDGEVSNVWDAMNEDGTLKDNFDTEENRRNWIEGEGVQYLNFKTHLLKTIDTIHGDYNELRGNMATEQITGKTILMFKRWLPRQIFQRFAVPQMDLETGQIEFKGRYRSHTQVTGAYQGALLGFTGLSLVGIGPLGLVVGGGLGLLGGLFYGADTKGLSFAKEFTFVTKHLALNLIRMPLNSIAGKQIIKDSDYGIYQSVLGEQDKKNMQSNMIELSFILAWIVLMMLIRTLLWEDNDDDDDKTNKRAAYNILMNRFMQLSSQAAMYSNPIQMWDSTMGSLALLRFLKNMNKTFNEAADFLTGEDIILTGVNAGESALWNQIEKSFFPSVFRTEFGFEAESRRVFQQTPFDNWFLSDKTIAKRVKSTLKQKAENMYLSNEDLSNEEREKIQKQINSFYRKDRDETYTEALERVRKGFEPQL